MALFQIMDQVGEVAYTLKLPVTARMHPTFQVSLLKQCFDPNVPVVPFLDAAAVQGTAKVPFSILDRLLVQQNHRAMTQVLIHWTDGLPEEAAWVSWPEVESCFPDFVHSVHP